MKKKYHLISLFPWSQRNTITNWIIYQTNNQFRNHGHQKIAEMISETSADKQAVNISSTKSSLGTHFSTIPNQKNENSI